jgi:hypothetical protein
MVWNNMSYHHGLVNRPHLNISAEYSDRYQNSSLGRSGHNYINRGIKADRTKPVAFSAMYIKPHLTLLIRFGKAER